MFLINKYKTSEVKRIFNYLRKELGTTKYKELFEIILTDNGWEFSKPLDIEIDPITGEKIINVFYCEPYSSWQKGGIEKNHEFIRYVLPKKTTFKNLTQNDCNIIANHINSLCRESLNNNCPFKAMLFLCDENVLNSLNIYYIEPDEVQLNKNLLK